MLPLRLKYTRKMTLLVWIASLAAVQPVLAEDFILAKKSPEVLTCWASAANAFEDGRVLDSSIATLLITPLAPVSGDTEVTLSGASMRNSVEENRFLGVLLDSPKMIDDPDKAEVGSNILSLSSSSEIFARLDLD